MDKTSGRRPAGRLWRLLVAATAGIALLTGGGTALAAEAPVAPPKTAAPGAAATKPDATAAPAVAVAQPAAPRLLGPADGTLYTHYPRTTTVSWSSVAGAGSYRVEVQCLDCATVGQWSTWTTVTTTATSYSFTWVADNHARWRVTPISAAGGSGAASGWRRFYYRTGLSTLPAPVPLYPAEGAVFGHYPRVTPLAWGPVEGATAYVLEIQYCSPSGCDTWASSYGPYTLAGTDYTFDFVGMQPGRWRVTAVTSANVTGATSPWSNFRYTT